jgi:hypothetical protein
MLNSCSHVASAGTDAGSQLKIGLIEVCRQVSWYRPCRDSLTTAGFLGIILLGGYVVMICTTGRLLDMEPGFFGMGYQDVNHIVIQLFGTSDSRWVQHI